MKPDNINSNINIWTTKENLYLVSIILRYGDQNWTDISEMLNKIMNDDNQENNLKFSFTQCSKQYDCLVKNYGNPFNIYNELSRQRLKEINEPLKKYVDDYNKLYKEIELIASGSMDNQLNQIIEQMEREKLGEEIKNLNENKNEQDSLQTNSNNNNNNSLNINNNEKLEQKIKNTPKTLNEIATQKITQLPTKSAPNINVNESKVKISTNKKINESHEDIDDDDDDNDDDVEDDNDEDEDDVDMSPDTSGGCYITWKPDIATTPTTTSTNTNNNTNNEDDALKQTKKSLNDTQIINNTDKRSSIEWKPVIDVSEKINKTNDKQIVKQSKTTLDSQTPIIKETRQHISTSSSTSSNKQTTSSVLSSNKTNLSTLLSSEVLEASETQLNNEKINEQDMNKNDDKSKDDVLVLNKSLEGNEISEDLHKEEQVIKQITSEKQETNTYQELDKSSIEPKTSKLNEMLKAPSKTKTILSKKLIEDEEVKPLITVVENSASSSSSDTIVSVKSESITINESIVIENQNLMTQSDTLAETSLTQKSETKKTKNRISSIVTELRKKKDEQIVKKNESEIKSCFSELVAESPKLEQQESVSSSVLSKFEDEKAYKSWKKSIMMVLNNIMSHKHANVFMFPVKDDIAPGYSQIVYKPIDLTTIKKNIENGLTRTTREVQRDILLMFTNAIMYNSSNHDVHKIAREMYKEVIHHIELLNSRENLNNNNESIAIKPSRSKETRLSVASDTKTDSIITFAPVAVDNSGSNDSSIINDNKTLAQLKSEELETSSINSNSGISTPTLQQQQQQQQQTNTRKRRISNTIEQQQQSIKTIKRKRK